MCGLVGLIGDLSYADEAMMKRLLILDYFRGTDSTGLAAIRNDNSVLTSKIDSNPIALFDMKSFDKALNATISKGFIGHNRATTVGGTSVANAHPFTMRHITGAHNGTLDKWSFDDLNFALPEEYSVDSQAVFAHIAEYGIEDTIPEMAGAWALTYFNSKEGTMNFIRNKERPLWYAISDDFKKIFWASEWAMIDAALKLGSKTKLYSSDEGYTYFPFETDTLYSINLDKLAKGFDSFPDFRVKELKGKVYKYTPPQGVAKPKDPFTMTDSTTSASTAVVPFTKVENTKKDKSSTSLGSTGATKSVTKVTEKPWGADITEEMFHHITGGSCSFCHSKIEYTDVGSTLYLDDSVILCSSCSDRDASENVLVTNGHLVH